VWPPDVACPALILAFVLCVFVFVLVAVVAQRRLRAAVPVDAFLAVRFRATHVRDEPDVAAAAVRFRVVVVPVVDGVPVGVAAVVVVEGVLVVVVGAPGVVVTVVVVVWPDVAGAMGVLLDGVVSVVDVVGFVSVVDVLEVLGVVSVVDVLELLGVVSVVDVLELLVVVGAVVVSDVTTGLSATTRTRPWAGAGRIVAAADPTAATATAAATPARRPRRQRRRRERPALGRQRGMTTCRLAPPDKSCDAIR